MTFEKEKYIELFVSFFFTLFDLLYFQNSLLKAVNCITQAIDLLCILCAEVNINTNPH